MAYSDLARERRESVQEVEAGVAYSPVVMAPLRSAAPRIPDYLQKTYRWAYLDQRNAKYLDHDLVVKTILWWQHSRLEQAAFAEIESGQHILQSAGVYGNFSQLLAECVGPEGRLEVVDVAEVQVSNCRRKLTNYPQAVVRHEDVLQLTDRNFDAVCCYFLLHEMPDQHKHELTTVLLDSVRPGGKVVFVDYHKPHWAHPVKIVTSLVFDTLEPYAKGLWRKEIADFAGNDDRFAWRKETYFGGLYQKVVATRRERQ